MGRQSAYMLAWLLHLNIALQLKEVINAALQEICISLCLQKSVMTPMLKKTSLDLKELKNQVVLNVPFLAEVIEKL